MADENDSLGLDDDGADAAAPSKGGKGLLIPGLLKWVAIGIGAVILIVTVVVITVAITNGNSSNKNYSAIPASEEFTTTHEVLDWYTSLGVIQTKTQEANPASVRVEVVLGYKQGEKTTSTEITQRTVELKDYLRQFFTKKTAEDLRPQNEENLKIEIRNEINDSILSSSRIKDVRFMTLDVIQQ